MIAASAIAVAVICGAYLLAATYFPRLAAVSMLVVLAFGAGIITVIDSTGDTLQQGIWSYGVMIVALLLLLRLIALAARDTQATINRNGGADADGAASHDSLLLFCYLSFAVFFGLRFTFSIAIARSNQAAPSNETYVAMTLGGVSAILALAYTVRLCAKIFTGDDDGSRVDAVYQSQRD